MSEWPAMEKATCSTKNSKEEEDELLVIDQLQLKDDDEDEFLDCNSADGNDLINNNHIIDGDCDVDQELQKVVAMRAFLQSNHPSVQEVDDPMMRRFLRARGLNIDKASALLLKYLSWRRSFVPNGYISPAEIPNELPNNMFSMQGVDKRGRPIVVVYGDRHKPSKAGIDEFKRYMVYCLDRICARMPEGQESFLCIADMEGWGYAHCDIRGYISALSILQDCYPERLGKLLIIHVPRIFMAAWKVMYPFIDSNTRKKIAFVGNKVLKPTLLDDIDESQLPEPYGGRIPLKPIQDC